MNVYFSCSLTGGREDQPVYAALVNAMQAQGHQVLTAHLASQEVMEEEAVVDPATVYQRDISWVETCDVVVAEVSTPSHGVGYEIAHALDRGKPVLCCHRAGARVRKMLTGNNTPGLRVSAYRDEAEAVNLAKVFLQSLAPSGR
jgi:nucleoside 2-deoxyribosyltransferase